MCNSPGLRQRLAHVLWIGGPPDSGKTSIAIELARRYGMQVYHFDRQELEHFARSDPLDTPALYAAHPDRMSAECRWLGSPPEVMAEETIACWTERCAMAIDDILEMPITRGIVAEGPGFFPEYLAPIIHDTTQAVWLLPSTAFKIASATRRNKPGSRWETSDPDRAQRNLIERDLLMGEHIRCNAHELGLTVYEVDGSRTLDQLLNDIAGHFGARLPDISHKRQIEP